MIIHTLIQGSEAWRTYRAAHRNASDAPAMMGCSPYKTRSELIREVATGITKEVDAATQRRFDDGHSFEALARPVAEHIIGQDLYPVTGSEGDLSASFDGLTMCESIAWEHKTLNDDLRTAMAPDCTGADLPMHYQIQMEQQCLVSGAGRVLFMASKWNGDQLDDARYCWYTPNPELRAQIVAGWDQFAIDVANYQPQEVVGKPVADAICALPALAVQIRGEVASSNLPAFKAAAERFIANIKTDLRTDEDFVNADATIKFCDTAEKDLERAKAAAIAQTASIDELMRTVDHIREQLRAKRLMLEKLVKTKKEQIKESILNGAKLAYAEHVVNLEAEIKPIRLALPAPDFAGAMKNKRTLVSLNDAVDTLLASAKIATNEAAKDIRAKLAWHKENASDYPLLFADLQQIITKPMGDFQLVVTSRIAEHKNAEEDRVARARAEEQAKAEAAPAPTPAPVPARQAHHQANFDRFTADARERAEGERKAGLPAGSLRPESLTIRDEQIDASTGPITDAEIIDLVAEVFGMTNAEAVERLARIDFVVAREGLAA